MIEALAITVTVLMADAKPQDDARIVPFRVMPLEECHDWQRRQRSHPKETVDRTTFRKVEAVYYECLTVGPELQTLVGISAGMMSAPK